MLWLIPKIFLLKIKIISTLIYYHGHQKSNKNTPPWEGMFMSGSIVEFI
jgi:hypothetical protein